MMRMLAFSCLLLSLTTHIASAQTTGYTVVRSELHSIEMGSGEMTNLGLLGEPGEFRLRGLDFDPGGALYSIDVAEARLVRIDLAGEASVVGSLGITFDPRDVPDLTFDACGELWVTTGGHRNDAPSRLYSVNPTSGAATLVGSLGRVVLSLTAAGDMLQGVAWDNDISGLVLVDVDPLTAATFSPRPLEPGPYMPIWTDYDAAGILWGINTGPIIAPPPLVFTWVTDSRGGGLSEAAFVGIHIDIQGLAVAPASGTCGSGRCRPGETRHCLKGRRFQAEVEWRDFRDGEGPGRPVPGASDDSGLFWFFSADNWELQVKVLDGCSHNGHFWVLTAASTNVEYLLRVTDTMTGEVREYANALGQKAEAVLDTSAFATCASDPRP